ncbi:MAG: molybdenum ABC transporter ATP-binding protein [Candidatus Hydrogenedentes bacterium]|nr:molybdenum ABC transporter ATP-binding protein [Candidatus Hydrogenedentota bacterium]
MSGLTVDINLELPGFKLAARFDVPEVRVIGVFGPSGSGKTTLLRAVAGLERRARGHIRMRGETWLDSRAGVCVPAHKRRAGYVFQEPSLFPHLDVRGNLEYGLRRVPPGARQVAFDDAVDCLGIAALLSRSTAALSGGERQRVAMARAILTSPRLLLMDEPVASLDESSRAAVLPYVARLHDALGVPVMYVSHNVRELARLAHTVVRVEAGHATDAGATGPFLERLAHRPEEGGDAMALLEVTQVRHDAGYHLSEGQSPFGPLWMPGASRGTVRVQIRARDVSIGLHHDPESSVLNQWPAEVREIQAAGPGQMLVHLGPPGDPRGPGLVALITAKSRDALALAPGKLVYARVKGVQTVA